MGPSSSRAWALRPRGRRKARVRRRPPTSGIDQVFRMRHQPEHVEPVVEHAGDGIRRPVGVRPVPGPALARRNSGTRPGPRPRSAGWSSSSATKLPSPWAMANLTTCPRRIAAGERGLSVLDPQMLHLADEAELGVAHQHARQQAGLAQDLEAVADAEHQPAARRVAADRPHDRRARRDRAAAQIVAIGEAAGQHDEIDAARQFAFGVPDDRGLVPARLPQSARGVAFAIEPGKRMTAARIASTDLDRVILDDGVGEQALAGLAQRPARGRRDRRRRARCRKSCLGARFSRPRRRGLERALDRLALRIEDARLQRDDDARFHRGSRPCQAAFEVGAMVEQRVERGRDPGSRATGRRSRRCAAGGRSSPAP